MHVSMPTAPALSVFCVLATWMLCDFHRVGLFESDTGMRGTSLVAALLGGAMLGWVLDRPEIRARAFWRSAAVVVLVPLVGVLVTLASFLPSVRSTRSAVISTGALSSLALLPLVFAVLALARRVGRARPRSLVDDSDRRALWVLVASSVSLGAVPAVLGAPDFSRRDWAGVELSLSLACIATLYSFACFASDLRARLIATSFLTAKLRPAEVAEDEESPLWIDFGLGEQTSERMLGGGDTYRSRAVVDAVVRGDPWSADLALRRAVWGSLFGATMSALGLGLAIYCAA